MAAAQRVSGPHAGVTQRQIKVEARRLLQEKLKRMPWHQGCSPEEHKRRIEADKTLTKTALSVTVEVVDE